MPSFSALEKRLPPSNVVVPPAAFADTWDERPNEDVCIGLRMIPDTDLEDARIEAFRRAQRLYPNHEKSEEATILFIASFQDALCRWVVARGTCDPNDVKVPWPLWSAAPEDMALDVLSDLGVQRIFDAWERMRIEADITVQPATDEDLDKLADLRPRLPVLKEISPVREQRLRRLLRYVLEELETVSPEPSEGADPISAE